LRHRSHKTRWQLPQRAEAALLRQYWQVLTSSTMMAPGTEV
jgi:hypothetical protein